MIADYKRYLVEIGGRSGGGAYGAQQRKELIEEARTTYEMATSEAENLFSTHPLRLATALNHSVFLAEQLHQHALAIDVAKGAFDAALFDIQTISEDQIEEVLRAMQLLRDNYTLWELDRKAIL